MYNPAVAFRLQISDHGISSIRILTGYVIMIPGRKSQTWPMCRPTSNRINRLPVNVYTQLSMFVNFVTILDRPKNFFRFLNSTYRNTI